MQRQGSPRECASVSHSSLRFPLCLKLLFMPMPVQLESIQRQLKNNVSWKEQSKGCMPRIMARRHDAKVLAVLALLLSGDSVPQLPLNAANLCRHPHGQGQANGSSSASGQCNMLVAHTGSALGLHSFSNMSHHPAVVLEAA